MSKLKDKYALITGSSTGIGKEVALSFAEEGSFVFVTSNKSIDKGLSVVKEIRDHGGQAIYIQADLRTKEGVISLFSEVKKHTKRLDILVNNAGHAHNYTISELTDETLLNDINLNFTSAVLCSKEAIQIMPKGGHIINTASIRGLYNSGRKGLIGFSSAKAALLSFTKTLANELAPNIFVNAIAPGFIWTDFLSQSDPLLIKKWIESIPIKRFIKPEELIEVYLLLATSTIFTGSTITPDGGYTLLEK